MNKKPFPIPEIVARYQDGATLLALAAAYGTSWQTIGRRLQDAGVVLRTDHDWVRGPRVCDEAQLRALAASGKSCREIAQTMRHHEESVRKWMRHFGLPRLPAKARQEHNYFWRGGRHVDKQGYVLVKVSNHPYATRSGYVREHRLLMEQQLGRFLLPQEVVDHIDGNPSNNALENLRLFPTNADHLRATLTGKCPDWTPEGMARIRSGIQRANARRRATRAASKTDVRQSR